MVLTQNQKLRNNLKSDILSFGDKLALDEAAYHMIYSFVVVNERYEAWELIKSQISWKREIYDFLKTKDSLSKKYVLEILKREHPRVYLLVQEIVAGIQEEISNNVTPYERPNIVSKIITYVRNLFNEEKTDEEICIGS